MVPQGYRLSTAAAWQLIYQLFRRHKERYGLVVWETHPCTGLYDCLTIARRAKDIDDNHTYLADFNLPTEHLHFSATIDGKRPRETVLPARVNYVERLLEAEDPRKLLDNIEATLNLDPVPGKLPYPSAPVLAIGLFADLVRRCLFTREIYDIRSVYRDGSLGGSEVRMEARQFGPTCKYLNCEDITYELRREIARYWLVFVERPEDDQPRCTALVDLRGELYHPDGSWQSWGFYQEFVKGGYDFRAVADGFARRAVAVS